MIYSVDRMTKILIEFYFDIKNNASLIHEQYLHVDEDELEQAITGYLISNLREL